MPPAAPSRSPQRSATPQPGNNTPDTLQRPAGHDDEYLPAPAGGRKHTDAKVRDIRWRYDDGIAGVTQAELAAEFGVSASTVSDITTGRTWVAEVTRGQGSCPATR
jgi:hypothetical protein